MNLRGIFTTDARGRIAFRIEPGEARLPKPPITGKAEGERPVQVVLEQR